MRFFRCPCMFQKAGYRLRCGNASEIRRCGKFSVRWKMPRDSLLLTKYRTGISYNALVAGFTEIGETLEETVAREVLEETGVQVRNIRYYRSQPWGIASDILAGFYCEADGSGEIRMDASELKYAAWVKREEIELQPDDASLTNEMMQMFRDGKIHAEDLRK